MPKVHCPHRTLATAGAVAFALLLALGCKKTDDPPPQAGYVTQPPATGPVQQAPGYGNGATQPAPVVGVTPGAAPTAALSQPGPFVKVPP